MNKKSFFIGVLALLAAPLATAGDMPKGMIAGYVTNSELDVESVVKDDGTGFGVRGWVDVSDAFFVHGEYQTTSLDGGDLQSLRVGGGVAGELGQGSLWLVKGEYVDFGSDVDEDGFGAHGGVMFN